MLNLHSRTFIIVNQISVSVSWHVNISSWESSIEEEYQSVIDLIPRVFLHYQKVFV